MLVPHFAPAVYGWIMDRMPRFRGRQISGALYAISRLNLYNGELVTALVQVRGCGVAGVWFRLRSAAACVSQLPCGQLRCSVLMASVVAARFSLQH